jgi:hypothetical protein
LWVKSERRRIRGDFATFIQRYQNTTYIIEKSTQINTIAPWIFFCKNLNKTKMCGSAKKSPGYLQDVGSMDQPPKSVITAIELKLIQPLKTCDNPFI